MVVGSELASKSVVLLLLFMLDVRALGSFGNRMDIFLDSFCDSRTRVISVQFTEVDSLCEVDTRTSTLK